MRNLSRPVLVGGGVVLTAIVAYLAFGFFGVHTAFIDNEVSEDNPFAAVELAPTTSDNQVDGAEQASDDATTGGTTAGGATAAQEPSDDQGSGREAPTEPQVRTVTTGSFVSNSRYTTVGEGLTITDGTQTFLRFEGFETNNGPDLDVYLRNSDDPDDYIDLGDLKGNIGDQNYELPTDIDLERYDLVDIWCVRFGVSFGSATLTA